MRLDLCLCGPRRAATTPLALDAAPRAKNSDPTGTLPLQRDFGNEMNKRWDALRRVVPSLVNARTNAASTIEHAAITGQDPVRAFQSVLDKALKMVIVAPARKWMLPYVRNASDLAIARATDHLKKLTTDAGDWDESEHPRAPDGKWTTGSSSAIFAESLKSKGVEPIGSKINSTSVFVSPKDLDVARKVAKDHPMMVQNNSNPYRFDPDDEPKSTSSSLTQEQRLSSSHEDVINRYIGDPSDVYSDDDAIGLLNESINKSTLTRDITVYRGFSLDNDYKFSKDFVGHPENFVGKTVPGSHSGRVVSTTLSRGTAKDFSEGGFTVEIDLKRGDHALDLTERNGGEKELLLSSYGRMRITSYDPKTKTMKADWVDNYTSKIKDAFTLDAAPQRDRIPPLQTLAHTELQGIAEAVSQQAVRAFADGMMVRKSPSKIARDIQTIIDKVGKSRSALLVGFIVMRAFSAATLDAFRAAGVTHVGTKPESRPARITTDAKKSKAPKGKDLSKIYRQERKIQALGEVDVLTAGDDDVCPICEDISEEGPYDIDEAETLIPAHPNCRCAFVPANDMRFAHDSQTHTAAGIMFMDPTGRVLFVRRSNNSDHPGEWCFPGGAIEPGETAEMAARREAQEEVGYSTSLPLEQVDRRELGGVEFTTFVVEVPEPFEPVLDSEHTEAAWRMPTDAPEPLHPGVRATIDRAVQVKDDFNPNQPRDKTGKWTETGAESGNTPEQKLDKAAAHISGDDAEESPVYKNVDYENYETGENQTMYEVKIENADEFEHLAKQVGVEVQSIGKLNEEGSHVGYLIVGHAQPANAPTPTHVEQTQPIAKPTGSVHKEINFSDLTKVGGQKGSNEGGVYRDKDGNEYYVKKPKSKDHVNNELVAAALYKLAGVNTLDYVPVKGGEYVATRLRPLEKNNVSQLTPEQREQAQSDFAVHAWLANWDAVGTGGDNVGVVDGKVTTLDTGGSLAYRAQGAPKGAAFTTNDVPETNTLRDPSKNPDAAKLYGNMTNAQAMESMKRVTALEPGKIIDTVTSNGGAMDLALKVAARRNAINDQLIKMGDVASTKPESAPPQPATVDHPAKIFKSQVSGTSAERVAMRKKLQDLPSYSEEAKTTKLKIIASFWKQHDKLSKTSATKAADIASKLGQYSLKYKIANPLTTPTVAAHAAPKTATTAPPVVSTPKPTTTPAPTTFFKPPPGPDLSSMTEDQVRVHMLDKVTHGGASDWVKSGATELQKSAKLQKAGLTASEIAYVRAFTGPYSGLNRQLRDGHMSEEVFYFKHIMNDALDKFPVYDGETLWRKVNIGSDVLTKYNKVGSVVHWPAFSSTAKNPNVWSGNTQFVIHRPKTGRDVQFISSHKSEAEVVMPADTYYKVLAAPTMKKCEDGVTRNVIELEEVVPFGKKKVRAT